MSVMDDGNPYVAPQSPLAIAGPRWRSRAGMLLLASAISFLGIQLAFVAFGMLMGRAFPDFILARGFQATSAGVSLVSAVVMWRLRDVPWLYFLFSFMLSIVLLVAVIFLLTTSHLR